MKRLLILLVAGITSALVLITASGFRQMERRVPAGFIFYTSFNAANADDYTSSGFDFSANNGASTADGVGFVDSSNDYFSGTTSSVVEYDGSTSMTIGIWTKRSSGTGSAVIFHNGRTLNNTPYKYWSLRTLGSSFAVKLADGTDNVLKSSGVSVSDGAWHHCVAVIDADTDVLTLYVDGDVAGTEDISSIDDCSNSDPLTMGIMLDTSGNPDLAGLRWHGYFDDPFIKIGTLTATEIKQLYEGGRQR